MFNKHTPVKTKQWFSSKSENKDTQEEKLDVQRPYQAKGAKKAPMQFLREEHSSTAAFMRVVMLLILQRRRRAGIGTLIGGLRVCQPSESAILEVV